MPLQAASESTSPRCLGCDYILTGLAEHRCPECGRGFDPNNPKTMRVGRTVGRFGTALMKPPGWPMLGATVITGILTLAATSVPGNYQALLSDAQLLVVGLAVVWMLRLLSAMAAALNHSRKAFADAGAGWRWMLPVLILVVSCGLSAFGASQRQTF